MRTASAPGKVFLFGEYAVLTGAPAWVAAIGPRFSLARADGTSAFPFAAASPAGRVHARLSRPLGESWSWADPHRGRGGFGASGAQFVLTYRALAKSLNLPATGEGALTLFHELHAKEPVPPSGADIASQWVGGVVRYTKSLGPEPREVAPDFDRLLLFSATDLSHRKINTHEHLSRLGTEFFETHGGALSAMKRVLDDADHKYARAGRLDTEALADIMSAYASTLFEAGLESPAATEDRLALSALPGVRAVKGTGAGLCDALWVILKAGFDARASVIAQAERRGLRHVPVTGWEQGISEEAAP